MLRDVIFTFLAVFGVIAVVCVALTVFGVLGLYRALRSTGTYAVSPASPASILGLPSIATVILGLIDGAATILVHDNLGISTGLSTALSTLLVALGGLGVQPLLGPAFKSALHLPFQVTALITAGMSALTYWLSTNPGISGTLAGWLTGGVAFLAAVGFGTTVTSIVAAYKRAGVNV